MVTDRLAGQIGKSKNHRSHPAERGYYMFKRLACVTLVVVLGLLGATAVSFAADLNDVINVLPKFAIPMREVGDRFQNMYFAAKGGNWALAFYMSKYMNGALNPAQITKPDEYPLWKSFYTETFDPVNKAIFAKDFPTFEKAYMGMIGKCNECHSAMGYGFIKVVKMKTPANIGIAYTGASKAEDVPK
jgi:hypothetical protein